MNEPNTQSSYLPLHLKYRPKDLPEFVGNKPTLHTLETTLARPAPPHSYLLTGPKGTGKTTLARIIADRFGCSARDFHEMNSASYRGIDSVRELIGNTALRPWEGPVAVYLLDECHQLTKDAQNALLKTLEEPPRHVYFVLATTDPDKLLPTIRSRCAHFVVASLARDLVEERLLYIVEAEGCPDTHPTNKVLAEIARLCDGSLRQAVMMLDQVIDLEKESDALAALVEGIGDDRQVIDLCRALLKGQRWGYIRKLLHGIDADAETVRYSVLGYMNTVLLTGEGDTVDVQALRIVKRLTSSLMYAGRAGLTLACYEIVVEQQEVLRASRAGVRNTV